MHFVTDFSEILEDEEIDLVVECMGGTTVAWEIVSTALKAKKHVVTSNKALLSKYLSEIEKILSQNSTQKFGYEASVGGGIPIIHTISRDLIADEVSQISEIMNGTTNFILSKMELEGAAYSKTLQEAQDLGFAEADPTVDVEGYDARSKIAILAKLAFGVTVDKERIFTQGISRITSQDFAYAKQLGGTIKILVFAEKQGLNYSIFVSPMVVPVGDPLAQITGATNAVSIQSKYLQETVLVGQGAGRFPTSNAVVSDIVSIAREEGVSAFLRKENLIQNQNIKGSFYIRFRIKDQLGIIRRIAEICEQNGVSIDLVLQLPIQNPEDVSFVITTNETYLKNIQIVCEQTEKETFYLETPFFMFRKN